MDSRFKEVKIEDIIADPNKFGAPTFEQFCKNPERFRGRPDDILSSADRGSSIISSVQKQIYEIEGVRCKTLEEVERVAGDMGISLKELDYRAELIPLPGQNSEILVRFVSKRERKFRI